MSDLFQKIVEDAPSKMTTAKAHNEFYGIQEMTQTAPINAPVKRDETSFAILRKVQELVKYYYAPGMHPATFELKLDRLGDQADKEIAKREAEIK